MSSCIEYHKVFNNGKNEERYDMAESLYIKVEYEKHNKQSEVPKHIYSKRLKRKASLETTHEHLKCRGENNDLSLPAMPLDENINIKLKWEHEIFSEMK